MVRSRNILTGLGQIDLLLRKVRLLQERIDALERQVDRNEARISRLWTGKLLASGRLDEEFGHAKGT